MAATPEYPDEPTTRDSGGVPPLVARPEIVALYERLRYDPETGEPIKPPSSNTGVTLAQKPLFATNSMYGWDWSQTTHDGSESVLEELVVALGGIHVKEGKGLQGWARSIAVYDAHGYLLARIYFGGRPDVHVISTGAVADQSRRRILHVGDPRTARVDTRVDTLIPYDRLVKFAEAVAADAGAMTGYHETRRGDASMGRTTYVGAKKSMLYIRVYEKWLESPGQFVDGTNRVEVQLRPPSRSKAMVSLLPPAGTFCASRTARDFAKRLGDEAPPVVSLRVKRAVPELDQKIVNAGHQYGNAIEEWLDAHDGDLSGLMLLLRGEAA